MSGNEYDVQISKQFYSNCLIEAIKAKIKDPKNVKIVFVPKRYSKSSMFHCFWYYKNNDRTIFDFKCENSKVNHIWQALLFRGRIRSNKKSHYEIMMRDMIDSQCKEFSKKLGKQLSFKDKYTEDEERLAAGPALEAKWININNKDEMSLIEGQEVQVFYMTKSGQKKIVYSTVINGKVDIGNYKPIAVKIAMWNEPDFEEDN